MKNIGGEENILSQISSTSHLQNQENFEMEPEEVKELELKRILVLIIMFSTLRKIPQNLKEALTSLNAILWKEAVNDEMESLISNRTWKLVDLPPGCKWVLRKKLKQIGRAHV